MIKSKIKLLFVSPYIPLHKFYGVKYARFGAVLPPLGQAYITAYLKKNGYYSEVLDANKLQLSYEETSQYVGDKGFDVVGIYATTLGYAEAVDLARIIKKDHPHIKLMLGGPHSIGEKHKPLEQNPGLFDYVCCGEGEIMCLKLVKKLEAGETDLSGVDGLGWRNGDKIVINPINEIIDMDEIGSPSQQIGDFRGYHQKIFSSQRTPFSVISTTRGCPFKCVFCSSPGYLQSIQGKKLRHHSLEWLDNELDYLVNHHGVREIYFVDDTFNVNTKRVFEMCDLFMKKYPKLIWSCNFESNIASKELLVAMKKAGCWSIMIGAESGNQDILRIIRKRNTIEQMEKLSKWCLEVGMMGRASFIIGHPGETPETIRDTINLATRINFPFITFSLMTPFEGTELYDMAEKYGTWKYDTDNCSLSTASYVPFGLTKEYLEKMQKKAHLSVYSSMAKNLRLLRYMKDPVNRGFVYHVVRSIFSKSGLNKDFLSEARRTPPADGPSGGRFATGAPAVAAN